MTNISKSQKRRDGRTNSTLRPLSSSLSVISRADGSAKFTSGSTSIIAAVYGPISPKNESLVSSKAEVVCVFQKSSSLNLSQNLNYAMDYQEFVANTLSACVLTEEYPRSMIEVVFEVLTSDGGILGVAIHAAVLALMDAGVAMKSLPIATSCLVMKTDDEKSGIENNHDILLDPSAEEEEYLQNKSPNSCSVSVICIVTDSRSQGVISSLTGGCAAAAVTPKTFLACIEAATRASVAVAAFMKMAIEQKLNRENITLWSE